MLNRAPKLSLALLLCSLPAALASQAPTQTQDHPPTPGTTEQPDSATLPVFKANAQTVVVNVVVTGRDGKPVHGLSKDRFMVAEDGHPQSITSFEEHTAGANTQPVALPKLPPYFFTNVPRVKPDDALTVLLLDSLNTQIQDQATVREEMKRYLANPVPNRRIAIFTLSSRLRLIQGFTDDPAILSAALKTLKNGSGPQESDLLRTRADATLDQTAVNQIASSDPNGGATAAASAAALSQFFAEQTASQTSLRVDITIDAFQQLARYLGGIPGRKNVAWFSSSFPLQIFPDPGQQNSFAVVNDSQEKVRKTDAMLAAAQVAIYPIAAEGNAPDSHYDVETQAPSSNTGQAAQQQQISSLQSDSQQRVGNHTSMDVVADETGGKATYNTNGLAEALTQVATSGSEYYSLSYSPTNPAENGQYRKIAVKVSEGKVKLAYRRGYYAADAKLEKLEAAHPNADPLAIFMRPGFPDSTEVPLVLRVRPEPAATDSTPQPSAKPEGDNHDLHGPLSRYSVDVIIAARGLQLAENSDRSRHGKVMAALVAYDNNGQPLNWVEREVPLDMDAARFAAIQDTGVNFRLELDVPKDTASLRTGVMDVTTGHTGTLEIPLSDVAGAVKTVSQTK